MLATINKSHCRVVTIERTPPKNIYLLAIFYIVNTVQEELCLASILNDLILANVLIATRN